MQGRRKQKGNFLLPLYKLKLEKLGTIYIVIIIKGMVTTKKGVGSFMKNHPEEEKPLEETHLHKGFLNGRKTTIKKAIYLN